METVLKIKNSDKPFPRLGLGTWKLKNEIAAQIVYEAIKIGYRHIDCAAVYGNEKEVGEGIQKALNEKIINRDDLWVTSKLWSTHHNPKHVQEACEYTLKQLNLKYLDLYLIHNPISIKHVPLEKMDKVGFFTSSDPELLELTNVPLSECWKAMESLVDKKLVKHIGVSNFDLQLTQDLIKYCRIKPLNLQIELHPFLQHEFLTTFCHKNNIIITAYSPFGLKSYRDYGGLTADDIDYFDHEDIKKIAAKYNKTPSKVVLRWSLQRYLLGTVIPKTSTKERLQENFDVYSFELDKESMDTINKLERGSVQNEIDSRKQIDQMVNFILHEAQDKAQEIEARALEEFNVEKLKLVQQKKQEFLNRLQQKTKEIQTEQAVALSLVKNEAKLQKVRAQQDALDKVKEAAVQKLKVIIQDKQKYQKILSNLLYETFDKLRENSVLVRCRKEDESVVIAAIPAVIIKSKQHCLGQEVVWEKY